MFGQYGYQPYQYGAPSYQPLPQSYQQPQQSGITWVESDAGAEAMRVEPGRSALAMNANAMLLYMKSCDPNGIPATRKFKLVEVTNEPAAQGQYVSLDAFNVEIGKLRQEIQAMRGADQNG